MRTTRHGPAPADRCGTELRRTLRALRGPAAALSVLAAVLCGGAARAEELATIEIALISQATDRPPALSNLVPPPADEGLAGARLAIADNNTTGRFLKQAFTLRDLSVPADGDALAAFADLRRAGIGLIVLNVPADALLAMADAAAGQQVLLFNAGAPDDRLRGPDCRDNVLHIAPSRAMLADALAQYLVWKRWREWFLIVGPEPRDRLFAEAIRQAARKFGAKLVAERTWDFGPDTRRTAQAEVPVLTQGIDYDMLIVADEIGAFGEYLPYRTWQPRPVAGTQGLVPTTWHSAHEQWGSAQLQSRFLKANGRRMTAIDHNVWAAIRAIGEAATRAGSGAFPALRDYIRSPAFELAGFKGVPLTFRDWNWQLRQPILLVQPTALVSVSPQDGFLHPRSPLDTLGFDRPEAACELK